jgi:hypothetical protein
VRKIGGKHTGIITEFISQRLGLAAISEAVQRHGAAVSGKNARDLAAKTAACARDKGRLVD